MKKVYLDTSAIVKRYVTEIGSETVDAIYGKAEVGQLTIAFSLWNIGELLGVLDENRRRKWLTEKEFRNAIAYFGDETAKLARLKTIEIIPITTKIVTEAWNILLNYHLYESDALQMASCVDRKSDVFLSADQRLIEACRKAKLEVYDIEKDEEELRSLIG